MNEKDNIENKEVCSYGTQGELSSLLDLWHYVSDIIGHTESDGDFEEITGGLPESFRKEIEPYLCLFENGISMIVEGISIGEGIREIIEGSTNIKLCIEETYPDLFEEYCEKISRRDKRFEGAWNKRINSKKPNELFVKLAA